MNNNSFVNDFSKYILSKVPSASLASGNTVIWCRCFECPDSENINSKHFYISLPQDANTPFLYYCHKCHCSGMVTYDKLLEWDIFDPQIASQLVEYNNNCSIRKNNKYNKSSITNKLYNNIDTHNPLSKIKLDYINNRIGTNMDYDEVSRLKICLNLNDLLLYKFNSIYELTRDRFIVNQLNENFIGFISIDNSYLNMRRICNEGLVYKSIDKRYVNYKLYNNIVDAKRFYTIPTNIPLDTIYPIDIHIAEGPFDILSIYKNITNESPGIYTSIGGSNYIGIILYFINVYKLPYIRVHYYPDNDKYGSEGMMSYIYNRLKIFNIEFYIHRNQYHGEKDFGVPKSRIIETVEKLL